MPSTRHGTDGVAETIMAATPEDAQAVLSVARESWHAAYDDIIGEDAVEAVLEDWYQLGDLRAAIGDSTFVVAEHDGTVVGFAHAGPNPDDGDGTYQLYRIYVRPDLWGRAIGGHLLDRVADAVRAAGGDRLRLGVPRTTMWACRSTSRGASTASTPGLSNSPARRSWSTPTRRPSRSRATVGPTARSPVGVGISEPADALRADSSRRDHEHAHDSEDGPGSGDVLARSERGAAGLEGARDGQRRDEHRQHERKRSRPLHTDPWTPASIKLKPVRGGLSA